MTQTHIHAQTHSLMIETQSRVHTECSHIISFSRKKDNFRVELSSFVLLTFVPLYFHHLSCGVIVMHCFRKGFLFDFSCLTNDNCQKGSNLFLPDIVSLIALLRSYCDLLFFISSFKLVWVYDIYFSSSFHNQANTCYVCNVLRIVFFS